VEAPVTSSFDASLWLRDVVGCRTASNDENRVLVGLLAIASESTEIT